MTFEEKFSYYRLNFNDIYYSYRYGLIQFVKENDTYYIYQVLEDNKIERKSYNENCFFTVDLASDEKIVEELCKKMSEYNHLRKTYLLDENDKTLTIIDFNDTIVLSEADLVYLTTEVLTWKGVV